tara:strand:- start:1871 stop:2122 length:252 start_codon:yes stop_codon:yes gene_type:complete
MNGIIPNTDENSFILPFSPSSLILISSSNPKFLILYSIFLVSKFLVTTAPPLKVVNYFVASKLITDKSPLLKIFSFFDLTPKY